MIYSKKLHLEIAWNINFQVLTIHNQMTFRKILSFLKAYVRKHIHSKLNWGDTLKPLHFQFRMLSQETHQKSVTKEMKKVSFALKPLELFGTGQHIDSQVGRNSCKILSSKATPEQNSKSSLGVQLGTNIQVYQEMHWSLQAHKTMKKSYMTTTYTVERKN